MEYLIFPCTPSLYFVLFLLLAAPILSQFSLILSLLSPMNYSRSPSLRLYYFLTNSCIPCFFPQRTPKVVYIYVAGKFYCPANAHCFLPRFPQPAHSLVRKQGQKLSSCPSFSDKMSSPWVKISLSFSHVASRS